MCGISGAIGSKIDMEKVKLLGLLNEDRGGDAVGIYANKTVSKTIKSYYHLLQQDDFPKKAKGIALNHSRKSSSGGNNILNAQPLMVDNDVFVLNGTVKNINTLERITGIEEEQLDNDTAYLFRLMRAGNTEWLKYYTGGATFVYRHKTKTTFWVGAANGKVERPLSFCYVNGTMYFSSLERDLKLVSGNNKITHFKVNTLITVDNEGNIVLEEPIDRTIPHIELSNLQKKLLACPYNESYSTLESLNAGNNVVIFCGGAYYLNNEFYTGKAKLDKHSKLIKTTMQDSMATYFFKNGILVKDNFFKSGYNNSHLALYSNTGYDEPTIEDRIVSNAHTIGLSDSDYGLIQDSMSSEMLYYSADLHSHFYNGALADGIISPIGSSTHYHFSNGHFVKMSYYSPEEFMDKVEDLHNDIDNLLYEFDLEDLDVEGASIFETLKQYKQYVKNSNEEWKSIT